MADASVRPALPSDAAEIGRIQVETWRTAYATVLPVAVRDGLDAAAATDSWTAAIAAPPTGWYRVLVALEQQTVVGFAALIPADDEDGGPATLEIAPLLVEPRWGRRGHGSRLLAACADTARALGAGRLVSWLPEADQVSRAFFASAGWAGDGRMRALDTGAGELREVRIHTSLA